MCIFTLTNYISSCIITLSNETASDKAGRSKQMSINAERSKAIRERIKNELGYTSKQVSVRSSNCGYSDETRITVKDLSCDYDAIQKIAMSFESIRYDEYSGEILSGANTYIFVEYDWKVIHNAKEAELENAEKAINDAELENSERNQTFYTDKKGGRYVIIPCGEKKETRRYSIAYFAKDERTGKNLNGCGECFEQAKWTIASYLAINKAKAA